MADWEAKLAECLESGFADKVLLSDLDAVLVWQRSIGSPDDSTHAASLLEKFDETELRKRFEEFLDLLIISDPVGYASIFPLSLDKKGAKSRYRQLIRLFHPDRGANDETWLNLRAERINHAYQAYQDGEDLGASFLNQNTGPGGGYRPVDRTATAASAQQGPGQFKVPTFTYKASRWRARFGTAQQVQRRLVLGATGIAVLLVVLVYLSTLNTGPTISVVAQNDASSTLTAETSALDASGSEWELPDAGSSSSISNAFDVTEVGDIVDVAPDIPPELNSEDTAVQDGKIATAEELLERYRKQHAATVATLDTSATDASATDVSAASESQESRAEDRAEEAPSAVTASDTAEDVSVETIELSTETTTSETTTSTAIVVEEAIEVDAPAQQVAVVNSIDVESGNQQEDKPEIATVSLAQEGSSSEQVSGDATAQPIGFLFPGSPIVEQAPEVDPVVQGVLDDYRDYFAQGERDQLMNLYMSTARENSFRGIDSIRKYYGWLFRLTTSRSIDMNVSSILQEDEYSAVVKGKVEVGRTYWPSSEWVSDTVDFSMVMVRTDSAYKIAVFNWKELKEN